MGSSIPAKLFIGPIGWRYGIGPKAGEKFLVLDVPLAREQINTLLIKHQQLKAAPYDQQVIGGAKIKSGFLDTAPFVDYTPTAAITELLSGTKGLAPIFLASMRQHGETDLYVQLRLGSEDSLFVWAGSSADDPALYSDFPAEPILRACISATERNRHFFNSHQYYYRKFWHEWEIEHKITVSPATDVYDLAVLFRNLIGKDDFRDYMWEYGDIFQQWDIDNHLFEIAGEPGEVGYVSFIPDSAGRHVVKRKRFASDGIWRREEKRLNVDLASLSYAEYLQNQMGLTARYLGSFRRTRFDVSCESTETGNVYSIMIDRCVIKEPAGADLCQVEIEYLHSRTIRDSAAQYITGELEHLVQAVQHQLNCNDIPYEYGPLSKMSYLRMLRGDLPRSSNS